MPPDQLLGRAAFVAGQIVHDHHIAFGQGGCQLGFHIEIENLFVHGRVDDPWRRQAMASQGGNEGLGMPVAEGAVIIEPLSERCPARPLGQFGIGRGFVKKDKAVKGSAQEGQTAADPQVAGNSNISALALAGDQGFFYG